MAEAMPSASGPGEGEHGVDRVYGASLFDELKSQLTTIRDTLGMCYNEACRSEQDSVQHREWGFIKSQLSRVIAKCRGMDASLTDMQEELEIREREGRDADAERDQLRKRIEALSLELDEAHAKLSHTTEGFKLQEQQRQLKNKGPEGEVVLVFTDVQASTVLWANRTDAMRRALDYHNNLLRRLIDEHNGFEVKTEGDAFMVAFSSCQAALHWCLEAQQGLLDLPWPEALLTHSDACEEYDEEGTLVFRGLRVRMGFDMGNPKASPDPKSGRTDYFGPDVNRCARIGGLPRGGEVFMGSAVFRRLRKENAFEGCVVTSKGKRQLKGIAEPEEIFSVLPEKLKRRKFKLADPDKQLEEKQRLNWWLTKVAITDDIKDLTELVEKKAKHLSAAEVTAFKDQVTKLQEQLDEKAAKQKELELKVRQLELQLLQQKALAPLPGAMQPRPSEDEPEDSVADDASAKRIVAHIHKRIRKFHLLLQLYIRDQNYPFVEHWIIVQTTDQDDKKVKWDRFYKFMEQVIDSDVAEAVSVQESRMVPLMNSVMGFMAKIFMLIKDCAKAGRPPTPPASSPLAVPAKNVTKPPPITVESDTETHQPKKEGRDRRDSSKSPDPDRRAPGDRWKERRKREDDKKIQLVQSAPLAPYLTINLAPSTDTFPGSPSVSDGSSPSALPGITRASSSSGLRNNLAPLKGTASPSVSPSNTRPRGQSHPESFGSSQRLSLAMQPPSPSPVSPTASSPRHVSSGNGVGSGSIVGQSSASPTPFVRPTTVSGMLEFPIPGAMLRSGKVHSRDLSTGNSKGGGAPPPLSITGRSDANSRAETASPLHSPPKAGDTAFGAFVKRSRP
eukprot:TRINITY_DN42162_c0_g1_i1.p1 TRINITY_DN42162_c0_g1~~TRINITY_DN42162_c0_g1_i1.p1  ORF type:complete len:844 (-),score=143.04 TRINITY_DN42162_c0_g1_i1:62-2593(-)